MTITSASLISTLLFILLLLNESLLFPRHASNGKGTGEPRWKEASLSQSQPIRETKAGQWSRFPST